MEWKPLDADHPFDPANAKFGVVVNIPIIVRNVSIWQDTTNQPDNLDMPSITGSVADLAPGTYALEDGKIYAQVIEIIPLTTTEAGSPSMLKVNGLPVAKEEAAPEPVEAPKLSNKPRTVTSAGSSPVASSTVSSDAAPFPGSSVSFTDQPIDTAPKSKLAEQLAASLKAEDKPVTNPVADDSRL